MQLRVVVVRNGWMVVGNRRRIGEISPSRVGHLARKMAMKHGHFAHGRHVESPASINVSG